MKILFLSRWFPYPADNGAKIRVYNLLRQLAARHVVHLISFSDTPVNEAQLAPLRQFCAQVTAVPYRGFQPRRVKALLGLFSPYPRSVLDSDSADMHAAIRDTLRGVSEGRGGAARTLTRFDLVFASQVDMAQYALHLPLPKYLDEIEITALLEQQQTASNPLQRLRKRWMNQKWQRYLGHLLTQFDGSSVVSDIERQRVEGALPANSGHAPITVIPNGVDIEYYTGSFGLPEPDELIYSGALTYAANFDAMQYFLGEIFPKIRGQRRNVHLTITGKTEGVALERLGGADGVTFTGYLPDIRPAISRSWVSVVPLRIGGGTRLKILESLALGTPVVATRKGMEGLELQVERDILLGDDPEQFAGAVLRLLQDADLWAHMIQHGRQTVIDRYDWKQIGQRLNEQLGETVALARRRRYKI